MSQSRTAYDNSKNKPSLYPENIKKYFVLSVLFVMCKIIQLKVH